MVFEVKIVARLEQYALKEVLVPVESLDITLRTRNMKQASRWYKNGWFALSCNQFQIWKSVHQEQEENKSCFHNRGSTMVTVYCACHLIKMSYLPVVPCYQFKLGWRICSNWSYFFCFSFSFTRSSKFWSFPLLSLLSSLQERQFTKAEQMRKR